jgi:prolyl 4-hydroxylase
VPCKGADKPTEAAVKSLPARGRACCIAWAILEAKTAQSSFWRKIITMRQLTRLPNRACCLTIADMKSPCESSAEQLASWPGVQRIPTDKLEIFQLRGFLGPDQCAALIALIDAGRRPSTIADANGDDYFRTSETCDLSADEPVVAELERRLLDLSAIEAQFGEPVQGQRYDVGQEFKAHTDYFAPGGQDYDTYCSIAGQRSWTFMVYLNEVTSGGGTRFKALGKIFQPEVGKLLCWNNRRPDGSVNPNSLHHGMKVRKGLKYVITKWYREKPWG